MKSVKNFKKSYFTTNQLIEKLSRKAIDIDAFTTELYKCKDRIFEDLDLEYELLVSNGLPLAIENNLVYLKSFRSSIKDQVFCIVDIETNGNNTKNGQIIELGAVKLKNGEIIDKYESLVYAKDIPSYVQDVTNITPDMLTHAPPLREVLEEFKIFLEDDVFVAHDIKFDYKFISDSFEKYNLGKLLNRKLCTIDLAQRTILADRYGLGFLKELLCINIDNHHRAYSDALSTTYILLKVFENLPKDIVTTEDLIRFSKQAPKLQKPQVNIKNKED